MFRCPGVDDQVEPVLAQIPFFCEARKEGRRALSCVQCGHQVIDRNEADASRRTVRAVSSGGCRCSTKTCPEVGSRCRREDASSWTCRPEGPMMVNTPMGSLMLTSSRARVAVADLWRRPHGLRQIGPQTAACAIVVRVHVYILHMVSLCLAGEVSLIDFSRPAPSHRLGPPST